MTLLRLRAERIARGWSQLNLAAAAKIHPSDVSRYENGHKMLPGHTRRIAQALGVPEQQLHDNVSLMVNEDVES